MQQVVPSNDRIAEKCFKYRVVRFVIFLSHIFTLGVYTIC
jgi:hypothetical protein